MAIKVRQLMENNRSFGDGIDRRYLGERGSQAAELYTLATGYRPAIFQCGELVAGPFQRFNWV
jgi:hypothetical protein